MDILEEINETEKAVKDPDCWTCKHRISYWASDYREAAGNECGYGDRDGDEVYGGDFCDNYEEETR